jgi:hypothetical protein
MAVTLLRHEAGSDLVGVLFHTEREREAARLFLDWFRARHGRATKRIMSDFGHRLESGELGFRYGRTTFYKYILKRFLDAGLIGLQTEYDRASGKVIGVYRRVVQPAPRRRPSGPSLMYNLHPLVKWNELFEE